MILLYLDWELKRGGNDNYSYLSVLVGFVYAALRVCPITVSSAITITIAAGIANIHQWISIRIENDLSQLSMARKANGDR